jgi:hypothetical protein
LQQNPSPTISEHSEMSTHPAPPVCCVKKKKHGKRSGKRWRNKKQLDGSIKLLLAPQLAALAQQHEQASGKTLCYRFANPLALPGSKQLLHNEHLTFHVAEQVKKNTNNNINKS